MCSLGTLVIDPCVQNLWSGNMHRQLAERHWTEEVHVLSLISCVVDGGTGTGLTGEQHTQGKSL